MSVRVAIAAAILFAAGSAALALPEPDGPGPRPDPMQEILERLRRLEERLVRLEEGQRQGLPDRAEAERRERREHEVRREGAEPGGRPGGPPEGGPPIERLIEAARRGDPEAREQLRRIQRAIDDVLGGEGREKRSRPEGDKLADLQERLRLAEEQGREREAAELREVIERHRKVRQVEGQLKEVRAALENAKREGREEEAMKLHARLEELERARAELGGKQERGPVGDPRLDEVRGRIRALNEKAERLRAEGRADAADEVQRQLDRHRKVLHLLETLSVMRKEGKSPEEVERLEREVRDLMADMDMGRPAPPPGPK